MACFEDDCGKPDSRFPTCNSDEGQFDGPQQIL